MDQLADFFGFGGDAPSMRELREKAGVEFVSQRPEQSSERVSEQEPVGAAHDVAQDAAQDEPVNFATYQSTRLPDPSPVAATPARVARSRSATRKTAAPRNVKQPAKRGVRRSVPGGGPRTSPPALRSAARATRAARKTRPVSKAVLPPQQKASTTRRAVEPIDSEMLVAPGLLDSDGTPGDPVSGAESAPTGVPIGVPIGAPLESVDMLPEALSGDLRGFGNYAYTFEPGPRGPNGAQPSYRVPASTEVTVPDFIRTEVVERLSLMHNDMYRFWYTVIGATNSSESAIFSNPAEGLRRFAMARGFSIADILREAQVAAGAGAGKAGGAESVQGTAQAGTQKQQMSSDGAPGRVQVRDEDQAKIVGIMLGFLRAGLITRENAEGWRIFESSVRRKTAAAIDWLTMPQHIGVVMLTPIAAYALEQAAKDVRDRADRAFLMHDLITHPLLRPYFVKLVASHITQARMENMTRYMGGERARQALAAERVSHITHLKRVVYNRNLEVVPSRYSYGLTSESDVMLERAARRINLRRNLVRGFAPPATGTGEIGSLYVGPSPIDGLDF